MVGISNHQFGNTHQVARVWAMAGPRSYRDACGIARALDLVGERWALLVVRELLLGPKRYTDLRSGVPGVGPDVLAQRLRELERDGLVQRRTLPPPAASRVYELTDRGRALEPVLVALGRWGSQAPLSPDAPDLGTDALLVALKTQFDPVRAGRRRADYDLRLGARRVRLEIADGRLGLTIAGPEPDPPIDDGSTVTTIRTDPATLTATLWHGLDVAEAQRTGRMAIHGSVAAVQELLGLFPLPGPVLPVAAGP